MIVSAGRKLSTIENSVENQDDRNRENEHPGKGMTSRDDR